MFDDTFGSFRAEYGNYNSIKLRGMFNTPLGDMFALRIAGTYLKRDGFGENLTTGNDVDDRNIWAGRATLGFQPDDTFSAYLMWDHFDEDDSRSRIGKQLCVKDTGPANIGGTPDQVRFNIAGAGVHTINVVSAMPNISDVVIIANQQATGFMVSKKGK